MATEAQIEPVYNGRYHAQQVSDCLVAAIWQTELTGATHREHLLKRAVEHFEKLSTEMEGVKAFLASQPEAQEAA